MDLSLGAFGAFPNGLAPLDAQVSCNSTMAHLHTKDIGDVRVITRRTCCLDNSEFVVGVDSSFTMNTFINNLMSQTLQIKESDFSQSFSHNVKVVPWHNNIYTDEDIS